MPKSIPELLQAVVPLAERSLSRSGTEAEDAAREAVRTAAGWFLDGESTEALRGHELNKYAIEQFIGAACQRLCLPPDRASAASSGVDLFAEGVKAAALREQHGWGWARPRLLSQKEAERHLRAGVQHLVNMAVYRITDDPRASARAQDAVVGMELDADQVVERVSPFAGAESVTVDPLIFP